MIRTRFAPSPTGYLHVGSARTALYCWLFAKKMKGQFILRIEDTDRERSTHEAIHAILESMEWLKLGWTDGLYYQMERLARYQEIAKELEESGHAYRCYCSKERLNALREELLSKKEKPRYDGYCRDRKETDPNKPYVLRFKNPLQGQVEFQDAVHGHMSIQNAELDDLVLLRTDGVPTYNFGVVVDDIDMKITHVIRGDDHLANTPRQINIYKALGVTPPQYAHISMILGSDGKRLSKRHGAVSVQHYREDGILPEALLNYLVRLGWSHGDQEIFSIEEMIEYFDLNHINKSAAAFNTEKLLWLNQHYLKTRDPLSLIEELTWHFKNLGINISKSPMSDWEKQVAPYVAQKERVDIEKLTKVIEAQKERVKTLKELAEKSRYFYEDLVEIDKEAKEKHLTNEAKSILQDLCKEFSKLTEWDQASIHQVMNHFCETKEVKLGKVAQPLRVAVTGNTMSPPIDLTLELIGKERVIKRLEAIFP